MNRGLVLLIKLIVIILALSFTNCQMSNQSELDYTVRVNVQLERPFNNATYFLYGYKYKEQALIDTLEMQKFRIKALWVPYSFEDCMGLISSKLVILLKSPDERILKNGFTTDSSQIDYCVKSWKKYLFK